LRKQVMTLSLPNHCGWLPRWIAEWLAALLSRNINRLAHRHW
jgi:hypothetical protein